MIMSNLFGKRLAEVRLSKVKANGRPMSHMDCSQLFKVHISSYSNWEAGRFLPDARSMELIESLWPEVFTKASKVDINIQTV